VRVGWIYPPSYPSFDRRVAPGKCRLLCRRTLALVIVSDGSNQWSGLIAEIQRSDSCLGLGSRHDATKPGALRDLV
jgi:hypothetical protein